MMSTRVLHRRVATIGPLYAFSVNVRPRDVLDTMTRPVPASRERGSVGAVIQSRRRPPPPVDRARTFDTMATLSILVLTVGILFVAREILVPIAIAILLSFVLSPLVRLMRKTGLGKTLSVGLVVFSTFMVAVGLGAMLAKQVSDLAGDGPRYRATMTRKVDAARAFAADSPILAQLNAAIASVARMAPALNQASSNANWAKPISPVQAVASPRDDATAGPTKVEIVPPAPDAFALVQAVAGTAATPLATAAFVAIFIVFILMQREDLRNRFIRLVGFGDIRRTTLAMDDAGSRLARYFLAQVLLNCGFGIVVAVALAILGVPGALMWGIVAMLMRFVPYVGAIGAPLFPILMAAVSSPGWLLVVETAALFVVLELVVGQIVEPLVYGHNTGISPIAVVASATFWTWLWGPVGLVLSTPLTVCLVVLGRHVDRLSFLDVILGSAPAFSAVEVFYQRMLAGDPAEIVEHADAFVNDNSVLDYCDQVAMKAILLAQEDADRGALADETQVSIRDMMRELVTDLADTKETPNTPPTGGPEAAGAFDPRDAAAKSPGLAIDPAWKADGAVVCLAARTPLDEAAACLLADLLGRQGIGVSVEPARSLTADRFAAVAVGAKLVILSTLDAGRAVAKVRVSVRRLRRQDVPVVVGFWMAEPDQARMTGLCDDVRADVCVANLPEAIALCLARAGMASPQAVAEKAEASADL